MWWSVDPGWRVWGQKHRVAKRGAVCWKTQWVFEFRCDAFTTVAGACGGECGRVRSSAGDCHLHLLFNQWRLMDAQRAFAGPPACLASANCRARNFTANTTALGVAADVLMVELV